MCGIFGVVASNESSADLWQLRELTKKLFILSESRGKESSGVALRGRKGISILKSQRSASELVESEAYIKLFSKLDTNDAVAIIGHSRLVTNGKGALNRNNQPVTVSGQVVVHNGIVVNSKKIADRIDYQCKSEVDTEALLALIVHNEAHSICAIEAVQKAFHEIDGNASIAKFDEESSDLILATDNGSLYYTIDEERGLFVFASERHILTQIHGGDRLAIVHLCANSGLNLDIDHFKLTRFDLNTEAPSIRTNKVPRRKITNFSAPDFPDYDSLARCSKCILPESFPGIYFDSDGICNKCHEHENIALKDLDVLKKSVEGFRSNDGNPDCLVGLSGGRDSCYGLHVIKNELGLNPIAYTYDWGLVTDLARRNISRMCGKLGVEHILVSADIHQKRKNVRKNIEAWLKKPDLAMIPLFMAGDKQFYYYAHRLRKQTGVDLFMFAAGNALERTDFKIAFSGLNGNSGTGVLTQLTVLNKLKLMLSYGLKFVNNPAYINSSLLDSFHAFYSSYLLKDDYVYLYHHYPWSESHVNNVLEEEYGWERSPDTTTTWRIGDGTAAFYNYIYYVVAGFTEHDTFRSNQIREGQITREEALCLVNEDNKPRWASLQWYANTVGFNLDEALLAIHRMPKLY